VELGYVHWVRILFYMTQQGYFLGLASIHGHHLTVLHLLFTSDTNAYPDKANVLGTATASIVEGCPLAIISFNTPHIIDSAMNQSLDESMNERQVSLLIAACFPQQ